ncbi:MAG: hypothetical protein JKY03_15640, partial [Aureispira sp.]|nr:hypothetical protein [Aureispira sp.]
MKFLFLTFFLIFCIGCTHQKEESSPTLLTILPNTQKEVNSLNGQLISHQQLLTWQIDSPSVILIDTRPNNSFQKGHLQGAFSLWRPDIQSNLFPYKGMMLEKQALELVLGQLGATSKSIF